MATDEFVSGRDLCRRFYREVVRPVLDAERPGLRHAAALLGRGSEVLGYDDPMSADHNVEPRVLIFVSDPDHDRHGTELQDDLTGAIPTTYAGRPTQLRITTVRQYLAEQAPHRRRQPDPACRLADPS